MLRYKNISICLILYFKQRINNAIKVIPFISDLLENYSEINSNQLDAIAEYEKENEDLNDIKPSLTQTKRDIKTKQNRLKEEKEREYFYLVGNSKESNSELDDIKQQAKGYGDIMNHHQNEIEKLTKKK